MDVGDYDRALAEFHAAYAIAPFPSCFTTSLAVRKSCTSGKKRSRAIAATWPCGSPDKSARS